MRERLPVVKKGRIESGVTIARTDSHSKTGLVLIWAICNQDASRLEILQVEGCEGHVTPLCSWSHVSACLITAGSKLIPHVS